MGDQALKKFAPSVCDCKACQSMCAWRPCWPTPKDAHAMIRAGLANRMMLDYWESDDDLPFTELVAPASRGQEGKQASIPTGLFAAMFWDGAPCVFFCGGKCELHDTGYKPTEGRYAIHKEGRPANFPNLHLAVARSWATKYGRAVVRLWKREVGYGR